MEKQNSIRQIALNSLAGFAQDYTQRLASLQQSGNKWQLDIASDGLDLDTKGRVEAKLIKDLLQEFPDEQFLVYYRPLVRSQAGATRSPRAPLPAPKKLKRIPKIAKIVLVASGKGGVGKSTVTANLAHALKEQGHRVGLLDADILGPSLSLIFGAAPLRVGADQKLIPAEVNGFHLVSSGLFASEREAVLWRGPILAKTLLKFFFEVAWGELDFLLCDLPPGTSDIALSIVENIEVDGAIIVTTPGALASADVHKSITLFEKHQTKILGLVENMAFHTCSQIGRAHV